MPVKKNQGGYEGTVLAVDDEESLLVIISEVLESAKYHVDTAICGKDAVERLSQKRYDVVITDIGMDDMSGWDLADIIYSKYPNTKVIVVSGWGSQIESGKLSMHHVNNLINKPFQVAVLRDEVEKVMKCSRQEVLIDGI